MSHDVLILSGSIGGGHDSVAHACREALQEVSRTAVVRDCMRLLGRVQSSVADVSYRAMLGLAPLYDAFHFSALRAGSGLATRSAAKATERLALALDQELDSPGLDAVIAVFATGAGVAGRARARRPSLGAFVVVTDATAHRIWVQPGVQRYIVFSQMAAGSVRQYDPHADVVVVEPPVRKQFLAPPDATDARRSLGIDDDQPVVLVMGGAWGRGPLTEIALALAEREWMVVLLAGSNRKLLARGRAPRRGPRPVVLAHSDDVARLMAAADVVVTSPGQACHEARAVGRPLVVMDTVPGHGRENLLAELAQGGALVSAPRPDAVVAAVGAVFNGVVTTPLPPAPGTWTKQFLEAVSLS